MARSKIHYPLRKLLKNREGERKRKKAKIGRERPIGKETGSAIGRESMKECTHREMELLAEIAGVNAIARSGNTKLRARETLIRRTIGCNQKIKGDTEARTTIAAPEVLKKS